ncbi:MAG: efflux RND transporter periplasmic adaptor subunit [Fibrobacter sp.]|nr:efflux RND transporter periplasmic adaptor subunit [Fibrobacter sp.]
MNIRNKKLIGALSAVILLVVLAIVLIARRNSGIEVEITEVTRGDITSVVSAPGEVRPLTEVQISTSIVGKIDRLPVNEGDRVKKGALLISLDQTEFRAQVRRTRANLDITRASMAQSRSQFNRAQKLFDSQLISEQEYEAARTQFLLDRARVKEAQAAYVQATEQLQDTRIEAPIDGTVTQLNVELGENVIPGTLNNPGTVLMVIADLDRMEIECEVDEADVAKVKKGQRAIIDVEAISGKQFRGSVIEVGYASADDRAEEFIQEEATVSYAVDIIITDTVSALKPGMTANVQIVTEAEKNVLMVPLQAVVVRPGDDLPEQADGSSSNPGNDEVEAVFIYDNGVARLIPVNTGITGEDYIQITAGLKEGMQIIAGPFESLRELEEGQTVRPQ